MASEQEVLQAVYRLNHRPRGCLGWKTPHEVFHGYKVMLRIPLMADSDSIPIADSVPCDGGHVARVS